MAKIMQTLDDDICARLLEIAKNPVISIQETRDVLLP